MKELLFFYWNPDPRLFTFNIPLTGRPILWYGLFFTLGVFLSYLIGVHLLERAVKGVISKSQIRALSETLLFYLIPSLIIGARLGDILFYQGVWDYLHHPLEFFKIWKGGLSSHGGAVGLFVGFWLFWKNSAKSLPGISALFFLDSIIPCALLASGFIRIGNFFNQELAGTVSSLPWAVIFGSLGPQPRHPVQLYEALFYLALFFGFYFTTNARALFFKRAGTTTALFLFLLFSFRFLIEFVKARTHSLVAPTAELSMGQVLSLPFIFLPLLFLLSFSFSKRKEKNR